MRLHSMWCAYGFWRCTAIYFKLHSVIKNNIASSFELFNGVTLCNHFEKYYAILKENQIFLQMASLICLDKYNKISGRNLITWCCLLKALSSIYIYMYCNVRNEWWNEWLMHELEGWMHKCFYAKHKGNLWRKTERNIIINAKSSLT